MEKKTTGSNKPLNPLAPPYLKLSPTLCYYTYIHTSPQHKPLISYNVHHYHPPKPFPHPPPPPPSLSTSKLVKKNLSALTSVPWGPRRGHLVNKMVRTQQLKYRLKSAATENVMIGANSQTKAVRFERSKRWKNTRGEYHETLPLEAETTSVMIKNLPNKYTRELLIQTLDNHCKNENQKLNNSDESESFSAYDHLYLPIDFKSRCNAGFAFVNFTNAKAALKFRDAFHGKRWAFFDSRKVAEISRAKIQGKKAILKYFKTMVLVCGSEEDLPVLFEPARDGSDQVESRMLKLGMIA